MSLSLHSRAMKAGLAAAVVVAATAGTVAGVSAASAPNAAAEALGAEAVATVATVPAVVATTKAAARPAFIARERSARDMVIAPWSAGGTAVARSW